MWREEHRKVVSITSLVCAVESDISGNTTRITMDEVALGIGVDLVERVSFTYVNGVCKMDIEGHKYAFRTKKVGLVDDLRAVLRLNDSRLEK